MARFDIFSVEIWQFFAKSQHQSPILFVLQWVCINQSLDIQLFVYFWDIRILASSQTASKYSKTHDRSHFFIFCVYLCFFDFDFFDNSHPFICWEQAYKVLIHIEPLRLKFVNWKSPALNFEKNLSEFFYCKNDRP